MRSETISLLIFDVGAEIDLASVRRLLGLVPEKAALVSRGRSPPYAAFPMPLEVRAGAEIFGVKEAPPNSVVEIRVHAIGAVALRVRVAKEIDTVRDLVLTTQIQGEADALRRGLSELGSRVISELRGAFIDPYDIVVEPEPYTIYCLGEGAPRADRLLGKHARDLAALVWGEHHPERLSETAITYASKSTVQYAEDDLVVAGWEHAVVVSVREPYEDVLDVIELANLELLEFRTYDAYLDRRLDQSFHALGRLWGARGLFRSARGILEDISGVRLEIARLADNLHDTGKLFGDWYLAKVHQRLEERFHLAEWQEAVATKMATLEDMYQLAGEEVNHRRTIVLEAMIVLLFVLDLILLWVLAK
jgi:hypothetical protein